MNVTISFKDAHGVVITISAKCDEWSDIANFIRDFKKHLLQKKIGGKI